MIGNGKTNAHRNFGKLLIACRNGIWRGAERAAKPQERRDPVAERKNPSEISDIFAAPLVGKRCKLSPREIQSGGPRDP